MEATPLAAVGCSPNVTVTRQVQRPRDGQAKHFVFTWNNYTLEPEAFVDLWMPHVSYAVFQKEIGNGTAGVPEGTKHYQGYMELKKPMRITQLVKILSGPHYAKRRGSREQARDYCMKAETRDLSAPDCGPHEINSFQTVAQGKRTDLEGYAQLIREGATNQQLAEQMPGVHLKYAKHARTYRADVTPWRPDDFVPTVYWFHGRTGTGKTRTAVDMAVEYAGEDGYWISSKDLTWFDGYEQKKVAIIDDFRAKSIAFPFLLRILDRYEVEVPFKGGFYKWIPELIIITTPKDVEGTYEGKAKYQQEDLAQLKRRITEIRPFTLEEQPRSLAATEEFIPPTPPAVRVTPASPFKAPRRAVLSEDPDCDDSIEELDESIGSYSKKRSARVNIDHKRPQKKIKYVNGKKIVLKK